MSRSNGVPAQPGADHSASVPGGGIAGAADPDTIRIVIVDDHPIVRQGLVAIFEDEPDFQVAGTAGTAMEGLHLVTRLHPDVVVLDLELPGMGGVEAIPRLTDANPGARVLVLTAYEDDERVLGALQAGAAGYLLKGAPAGEIARAIRAIHAGGSVLQPGIASRLAAAARAPRGGGRLTERERQVLRLVADGRPNKQIARELDIAERTVKFHLATAARKLGADNRAQAAALAIRQGLL